MDGRDPFGWVGSTIHGQFAVQAVAGTGGFGIVYRGTHLGLEEPIAIKCLNLRRSLTEPEQQTFLAQFRAEARLLHRLSRQTANIVQALDIGAATAPNGQWTPYIVMEWLEGTTLEHDLERRSKAGEPPLGFDAAIRILSPAVDALALAHRENVSHRDVKPANLFLWRGSGSAGLKVLDFGIAKVFSEAPSLTAANALTSEHSRAFTPSYGAPEQFSLTYGPTGPWTDVFAMALILIEVATGRRVIQGETIVDLLLASVEAHRNPEILRGVAPLNSPVASVIQRALAVRPAGRLPNMDALWSALYEARKATAGALEDTMPLDAGPQGSRGPSSTEQASPGAALLTEPSNSAVTLDAPRGQPPAAETGDPGRASSREAPPTSAPAVSENRFCTAMIVDVSSTAALAAKLDPDEVKDLLDRCYLAIAGSIEALGGTAERRGSDVVMGVFGATRASESDAERAVHAALRVHAALAKVRPPKGARAVRPSARIGISTGRALIEAALGASTKSLTVIGEAVIAAGRLQQAAAAGTIVIGRDTHRQIAGRFNVEPVLHAAPPGQGEPIVAFRIVSPVSVQHGLSPQHFYGIVTKLVGRSAERLRLIDMVEMVADEQCAAHVTVVGPAGVGRSRMLTEIVSFITTAERSFIVSAAQGASLAMSTSYGFAASLLRGRFGVPEDAAPEVILRRLRRGVRWLRAYVARAGGNASPPGSDLLGAARAPTRQDLDDALIQIAGLLDAQKTSTGPAGAMSTDEDGARTKHRISAAVACLVRFAASLAPVVILCDDAQWVDDASLDLFDDLVMRVEGLPVLVVCAARPEVYERRPHWGEGRETHRRVDLAPLERRHIEEMIRDRLRRAKDLSPQFVQTVAERADGNPFILDETLRLLVDIGVIEAPEGGGDFRVHELDLGALILPTTVQGIVQARLDRLEPPVRSLLARAAVVGKTFWESVVEELRRTADPATSNQDPTTAELLAVLRERQLVRAREAAMFPGERERVFAESATQEVAYEMLPARVRRPLHLLVAGWLKERAQGDAGAALLARHYDLGGDARAAAAAYERAAAHAAALGQNVEALRHLRRVCELHDDLLEEVSGEDAPAIPWQERARLRLDLGDVLRRLGRLDEAEAAFGEARAEIPEANPETLLWESRTDFRLSLSFKVRGDAAKARVLVERAIAAAKKSRAIEDLPAMYALLTFLHRRERDHAASWRTALEGLRVCRSIQRRDHGYLERATRSLLGLAAALFVRKRWVAAERTYRQAARIAARAGDLDQLGRALNGVGAVLSRTDYARARAAFLESLRVKEKAGDLHQIAVAYVNVAEVENAMNEHAAAHDHARRAIHLAEQIHAESDLAEMYRNLGAASLGLGKIDAAIDACLRALRVATDAGRVYLDGAVETLGKVCARAAEVAPDGAPLRARAEEIKRSLSDVLGQSFVDDALRKRIDALLVQIAPLSA